MLMVKNRQTTIKSFQAHGTDTGSTEVQLAVLTDKINALAGHLKIHRKDTDSRMGLLKMISQRRRLLSYLENQGSERYKKLIEKLGLRK
ncbi:MAG: 30S ribosomal protein S15 [Patescibacteria group bacterium]